MTIELIYVHDPMCAWCWAFHETFSTLKQQLSDKQLKVRYVLGGLAPDSDEPMPQAMQLYLQEAWQRIEQCVPGIEFNFEFWTKCSPRRSTYTACRAVLAAKQLDETKEHAMILAIQQAYYLSAQNPSNSDVLIAAAECIGLEKQLFEEVLHAPETEIALQQNIVESRRIGATSFPSLVLNVNGVYSPVAIAYTSANAMLADINRLLDGD